MKKDKGFTLLEMLIVVGCIVALVAIAYPSFSKYQEKNRENADVVAMHSAEALFSTAYNTGKIIEGRPATEATATNPLYYDGNGNLTWKEPAPYGKGTKNPSGVAISCCDDYEYNPSQDYTGGVIYCYYNASTTNPGIHIHWSTDGYSGAVTPSLPTKPTKPTFPAVPTTEATTPTTPKPTEETGSTEETEEKPKKEWTIDDILHTGHPYPKTTESYPYWTDDFPVVSGHRYVYKGKVYVPRITIPEGQTANYNDSAISPDGYMQANFVAIGDRVFTSKKNVDGKGDLMPDDAEVDQNGNSSTGVNVMPGDVFIQYNDDGTVDYYVRYSYATHGTSPVKNSGEWIKLYRPDECPDCGVKKLPTAK